MVQELGNPDSRRLFWIGGIDARWSRLTLAHIFVAFEQTEGDYNPGTVTSSVQTEEEDCVGGSG